MHVGGPSTAATTCHVLCVTSGTEYKSLVISENRSTESYLCLFVASLISILGWGERRVMFAR